MDPSDYETSEDEEKQLNDLRQLEEAVAEDDVQTNVSTADISKLSPEDRKRYDNLNSAIGLNKFLNDKLIIFEKQLISRLKECRERLAAIHADSKKGPERTQVFRYVVCGKPYFKDRNYFPPPDNQDTITMRKSGMYDFSDTISVSGWTVKDKSQFLGKIHEISIQLRKDELTSKIADLKRQDRNSDSKQNERIIRQLKREISCIKNMPLEAVVKPLGEEYDWEAISDALNNRHTALEYKALWKLFLHPAINKQSWSKAEHNKLQEIMHEYNYQDWDAIAEALGTGRSGYQCFVYFRTNFNSNKLGSKWTKEEEEYLRRLIDYYREDEYIPWGRVAASMENRTKTQIYNKFKRLNELRKGRFLKEEDAVILTCVEHFGPDWNKVATYIPGRSVNQIRKRYNVLNNSSKASVVWTVEDDKKLLQLVANQDSKFVNYSTLTEQFPTKTRIQLRARHLTLVKWMRKHPNRKLDLAPRRGARRLCHGQSLKDLNSAVENLKLRLQNEVEMVKIKKITANSSEEVIDHAIVTCLITETTREEANKKQNELSLTTCNGENTNKKREKDLMKILLLLRAKLNKNAFLTSDYFGKFPGLMEEEVQKSYVKVKCYSKINTTNVMEVKDAPVDVWKNPLPKTEYVLPPNYSTIIACRRLMSLASSNKSLIDSRINIKQIMKRSKDTKAHIDLFMERFATLFLWPMLLSNENPRKHCHKKHNAERQQSSRSSMTFKNSEKWVKYYVHGVTIPPTKETKKNEEIDNNNDTIDCEDAIDDEAVTVKRNKILMGNDDFLYLDPTLIEDVMED